MKCSIKNAGIPKPVDWRVLETFGKYVEEHFEVVKHSREIDKKSRRSVQYSLLRANR